MKVGGGMRGLLGELMSAAATLAGELAAEELIAEHGPKVLLLRAIATLRKIEPETLHLLALRIEATPAEPGNETRARSAAAELLEALAAWNDST